MPGKSSGSTGRSSGGHTAAFARTNPYPSSSAANIIPHEARKITIRHGPIVNLDMPAMTMVFQVKDAALLDQVKEGDKIRFVADKVGGQFWVMRMDPAR